MLPGRNHWGEGRAMGASRQALLCGYYGEHNIGDDALLAALLQQLPSGWTPLVTGYDQAELEQRFGSSLRQCLRLETFRKNTTFCSSLPKFNGPNLKRE
jgi:hypothetical protein